jgi:hypothetical protein
MAFARIHLSGDRTPARIALDSWDCGRDSRISTVGRYAPPRGLLVVRRNSFGQRDIYTSESNIIKRGVEYMSDPSVNPALAGSYMPQNAADSAPALADTAVDFRASDPTPCGSLFPEFTFVLLPGKTLSATLSFPPGGNERSLSVMIDGQWHAHFNNYFQNAGVQKCNINEPGGCRMPEYTNRTGRSVDVRVYYFAKDHPPSTNFPWVLRATRVESVTFEQASGKISTIRLQLAGLSQHNIVFDIR